VAADFGGGVMSESVDDTKPYGWLLMSWQLIANGLAAHYGAPVWLVGSALTKTEPPDYDIRIELPGDDFVRLYGPDLEEPTRPALDHQSRQEWRRMYDCLKQSRRLSRNTRRTVDFQVQRAEGRERYADKPRVRLDRAPEWFFVAGLGDA
jgi:hypothetical protein